jgi:hypothetical protein
MCLSSSQCALTVEGTLDKLSALLGAQSHLRENCGNAIWEVGSETGTPRSRQNLMSSGSFTVQTCTS